MYKKKIKKASRLHARGKLSTKLTDEDVGIITV